MPFDGIVTKKVTYELNNVLSGGKIDKIYEPNNSEILLGIYSGGKNYLLDICTSSDKYRICLTTNKKANPQNAPNFCMVLRKHILGYRIKNIETIGLERIVIITLEGVDELGEPVIKKMIVELMGKHSNIILVKENNVIIDSLSRYEKIVPHAKYYFPEQTKLEFTGRTFKQFDDDIKDKSLEDVYIGFSRAFVKNIMKELNIDDIHNNSLKVHTYLTKLINLIETDNTLIYDNLVVGIANKENENLPINNFFVDDYYTNKENSEIFNNYKTLLLKVVLQTLKRYSSKIETIDKKLKETENREQYRIWGELITSNLYQIDNNRNVKSITVPNYYNNNNDITIPLDDKYSPSYNAQRYFKKYNKLKSTLEIVSKQKEEIEKDIDYLENIVYSIESAENIDDLDFIYNEIITASYFKDNKEIQSPNLLSNVKRDKTHKKIDKALPYGEPIIYTVDGYKVLVGKNNKQNDYITTKLAKSNDLWFHTKDIRGSHVVLKCNGEEPQIKTIIAVAKIAAKHSKAKNSSNIPVDYTYIKDVKKPKGAKPGMVIYYTNKTVNV